MIRVQSTGDLASKSGRLAIYGSTMLIWAILVSGCAREPQRQAMMDNIESAVQRPKEAAPLDRYARAYAKGTGDMSSRYITGLLHPTLRCVGRS